MYILPKKTDTIQGLSIYGDDIVIVVKSPSTEQHLIKDHYYIAKLNDGHIIQNITINDVDQANGNLMATIGHTKYCFPFGGNGHHATPIAKDQPNDTKGARYSPDSYYLPKPQESKEVATPAYLLFKLDDQENNYVLINMHTKTFFDFTLALLIMKRIISPSLH